jgi:hypothetical protein
MLPCLRYIVGTFLVILLNPNDFAVLEHICFDNTNGYRYGFSAKMVVYIYEYLQDIPKFHYDSAICSKHVLQKHILSKRHMPSLQP